MMKYIIDRFEGEYAVCEDENGAFVNIPKDRFSCDARSGDIVIRVEGKLVVDKNASDNKRAEISALQKRLQGRCKRKG